MEKNELWMNKLKEKLENHSEPIPASGWERLEKELMPPVEKKIYPYRRWMMAAAAVILLALVSSVSLYFLGTPAADEIHHIQNQALTAVPDALPGVQQPDAKGRLVEPVVRPIVKENILAKAEQNIPEENTNIVLPTEGREDDIPSVVEDKPNVEDKTIVKNEADAVRERDNRPRRPSGKDKLHIPVEKSSAKKGTWSMGLAVGNSAGSAAEVGIGAHYMSRVSMLSVTNGLNIPGDQTLVFEDGIPYLRQAKQIMDIKHHQPISVGLSVRKSLGSGFSVESGLTYTLLSSDAKLVDSDHQVEQKLHYIGIPLRANWNFLDKKLVTLYVSGGGMVEKCVYGKLGSEKETVKPLQLSVSGAVGAQLNATNRVGIYIEPGVAYFFDDGSDVQTIRKENPFNFNVQAGIRFTY